MTDENKVEDFGPDVNNEDVKDLTEKQVKTWVKRIEAAKKAMRKRHKEWRRMKARYAATDPHAVELGEDIPEINVNLIPSTVNMLVNAIWDRNRKIFGYAEDSEVQEQFVPALEDRLRTSWRKAKPFKHVQRVGTDAFLFGRGFLDTVFETENLGSRFDKDGRDVQTDDGIVVGQPNIVRVSPFKVFVDPQATDLEDARWVVTEYERLLADVKNDPAYQNTDELKGNIKSQDADGLGRKHQEDDREPVVIMWKVQDKTTNTVFMLAKGMKDKTLKAPVVQPMPFKGFSLESLSFTDIPDQFWSLSEVGMWLDHQNEISDMRSFMVDFMKRWAWIWIARKGALDDDQKTKLSLAESGSIVEAEDPEGIRPLDSPALSADFGALNAVLQNDLDRISGVSDIQRGGSIQAKTATEASIRQNEQSNRIQSKRDRMTDFMDRVLGKMAMIIGSLDTPDGVPVLPEGIIEWQFSHATAEAFSPEIKRKLWTDNVTLYLPIALERPEIINPTELIRRHLEAHNVTDLEQLLPPAPNAGSGLTPDQENLLLIGGAPVQPTVDENFQLHVELHLEALALSQQQGLDASFIMQHLLQTEQVALAVGVQLNLQEQLGLAGGNAGQPLDRGQLQQGPPSIAGLASASA